MKCSSLERELCDLQNKVDTLKAENIHLLEEKTATAQACSSGKTSALNSQLVSCKAECDKIIKAKAKLTSKGNSIKINGRIRNSWYQNPPKTPTTSDNQCIFVKRRCIGSRRWRRILMFTFSRLAYRKKAKNLDFVVHVPVSELGLINLGGGWYAVRNGKFKDFKRKKKPLCDDLDKKKRATKAIFCILDLSADLALE